MQAHVFFRDTWHHPCISSCFCGKRFYSPCFFAFLEGKLHCGKCNLALKARAEAVPTIILYMPFDVVYNLFLCVLLLLCQPGLLSMEWYPSLILTFFHQLIFPCRHMCSSGTLYTIPTSLLVFVENVLLPLFLHFYTTTTSTQCKLQLVMTTMSASEVFLLVDGRKTPPAPVAQCQDHLGHKYRSGMQQPNAGSTRARSAFRWCLCKLNLVAASRSYTCAQGGLDTVQLALVVFSFHPLAKILHFIMVVIT